VNHNVRQSQQECCQCKTHLVRSSAVLEPNPTSQVPSLFHPTGPPIHTLFLFPQRLELPFLANAAPQASTAFKVISQVHLTPSCSSVPNLFDKNQCPDLSRITNHHPFSQVTQVPVPPSSNKSPPGHRRCEAIIHSMQAPSRPSRALEPQLLKSPPHGPHPSRPCSLPV
jgi:hypothetical protein